MSDEPSRALYKWTPEELSVPLAVLTREELEQAHLDLKAYFNSLENLRNRGYLPKKSRESRMK